MKRVILISFVLIGFIGVYFFSCVKYDYSDVGLNVPDMPDNPSMNYIRYVVDCSECDIKWQHLELNGHEGHFEDLAHLNSKSQSLYVKCTDTSENSFIRAQIYVNDELCEECENEGYRSVCSINCQIQ